jgi:predicted nucleotidyltransferase
MIAFRVVEHRAPELSMVERTLREYLAAHPHGAYAAYLFGSVSRGEARPDSDVDVAVLLEAGAPKTLEAFPTVLQGDLSELLNCPVDVVTLDSAPPDLIHRVLRDGRLVLDRDKSRRIAFEVYSRNVYFDLKPFLERYRGTPSAS